MKSSILKFSMTVSLPLLLSLILIVSFFSCSKPNLVDIVKEHFKAINNDDVEKDLTFFTDDIVFEIYDDIKLSGKDQLRNLMESDVVNKARLSITDIKVEGNTVIVEDIEKNEGYRLLGIEELYGISIYKFRGRLIEKVRLESTPESEKIWDEKYKSFAEWASKEHPEEFKKQETGGYTAENCRLYLSLLKEWRDKTSIERESAEQELIKLENELNDAWVNRDIAPFDRILVDDYMGTDEEGNVMTKAQELANIKSGAYLFTSAVKDDIKVRVYGDTAVVTGRSTYKGQYKGKEYTSRYRWTDTWVKDNLGRWRCVAFHDSNIARRISVEADVAAIKALLAEWVQLYNAGDFERLVSTFYAENAVLIAPDMPVRKGKEAILLGYQKYDELNKEHVDSSDAEEVRVSGNLAVAWGMDTGSSTPRSGGEPAQYGVNWLMAFERQSDGTWKCLYEIWNDNPLPETPEKKQQD